MKKKAEKCQALYVAHNQSSNWCQTWDTRISLITIILATLSGSASVGGSSILPFDGSTTVIGGVSIIVGMLQTITTRLAFAKRAESHRIASLAYQKLYHHLDLQMSIPRKERQPALEIIGLMKNETDRLAEIELGIPEQVKHQFHSRFGSLKDYSLPSVLNGLDEVTIYIEPQEANLPHEPPSQPAQSTRSSDRKAFR